MISEPVWAAIGLTAAALTATSFLPQLVTQWRHPERARVSYGTLAVFLMGSTLWTAYGVHRQDPIIVVANCFIFTTLVALTVLQGVRDLRRKRG